MWVCEMLGKVMVETAFEVLEMGWSVASGGVEGGYSLGKREGRDEDEFDPRFD